MTAFENIEVFVKSKISLIITVLCWGKASAGAIGEAVGAELYVLCVLKDI